jgi:hypothetical protein
MSGARVRWARGGEARIVSIGADAITLRSTAPAPPGSRWEGTVEVDGAVRVLRVKIHTSKREGEEFLLQGRPLDLTREVREYLETFKDDVPPAEKKERTEDTEEAIRKMK